MMSSAPSALRFDQLLIAQPRHPACSAIVIVPAKNEEETLFRMLDALRTQRDLANLPLDPRVYEVILLLNNCSDDSAKIAEDYSDQHPELSLHTVCCTLPPDRAFVGTARRLLMDAAFNRLTQQPSTQLAKSFASAILSTDADTVVAPDWIASNLAAIEAGADVVGGVIHLFPQDLDALLRHRAPVYHAYQADRQLQRYTAQLESILDPDPADPWPRHLEHFGASVACTPAVYASCGGLPPVRHLEDVAFIDALRRVGARIRHCPDTHIFTSGRFDGRAEVGLSGQLRRWEEHAEAGVTQLVDSAHWLAHRFRSIANLRRLNESGNGSLSDYPSVWHSLIRDLQAQRNSTPRFLQLLDCDELIEQTFLLTGHPRRAVIAETLGALQQLISSLAIVAPLPQQEANSVNTYSPRSSTVSL